MVGRPLDLLLSSLVSKEPNEYLHVPTKWKARRKRRQQFDFSVSRISFMKVRKKGSDKNEDEKAKLEKEKCGKHKFEAK